MKNYDFVNKCTVVNKRSLYKIDFYYLIFCEIK